mgnify:CR=1 FL=1
MGTMTGFQLTLNDIPADGLTSRWHVDDDFFDSLDDSLYKKGSVDVEIKARHVAGGADIDIAVGGELIVLCDRCNDEMPAAISSSTTLKVRRGDEAGDDGDIITVTDDDCAVDLAWNIYEVIALAAPNHPVHPEGECNAEMELLLQQHEPAEHTDARWSALEQLKDTIK